MRLTSPAASFVDVLQRRAERQPDDVAYVFLESGEQEAARITWAALERRSRAIGAAIAGRVRPGSRVLVMFPPGIEFAAGFFGCLAGGAIAVPAYPPSGGRIDRAVARLRGLVEDAGIALVVAPASLERRRHQLDGALPELSAIPWLTVEEVDDREADAWVQPGLTRDDVAFLQYTSGSTATPRGVMVTHGNLIENLAASARLAGYDESSLLVSWLPVNHDMGLIQGILQPAYSGFPAHLMAPAAFLQRPARWLQAVSRLGATHSGGPNFAYDLCVRRIPDAERDALDLGAWRVAFNGSEPVRRATLESFQRRFGVCGFRFDAFRPAYGLAESTLLVTSRPCGEAPVSIDVDRRLLGTGTVSAHPRPGDADRVSLVSCGSAPESSTVLIVDPLRRMRTAADRVGEIWVAGPSVARGYWRRPHDSSDTFAASLASGEGPYLRTGDLGFLRDGQLFVTGRIKDVIIVRGLKHYPQEIELTAERAANAIRPGCCAAFAFERLGEERAAIVAEIDPARRVADRAESAFQETIDAVRCAVAEAHAVAPAAVVLVTAGSLAKTTSGKLQRYVCRDGFLAGSLDVVSQWIDGGPIGALEKAAS